MKQKKLNPAFGICAFCHLDYANILSTVKAGFFSCKECETLDGRRKHKNTVKGNQKLKRVTKRKLERNKSRSK